MSGWILRWTLGKVLGIYSLRLHVFFLYHVFLFDRCCRGLPRSEFSLCEVRTPPILNPPPSLPPPPPLQPNPTGPFPNSSSPRSRYVYIQPILPSLLLSTQMARCLTTHLKASTLDFPSGLTLLPGPPGF